jgi:hypothetical protein
LESLGDLSERTRNSFVLALIKHGDEILNRLS